jgi:hypothetical protein
MRDRGRESAPMLTVMRSLHSNAVTALGWNKYQLQSDEDGAEMLDDLNAVIAILDKWKRTGKTR